MGSTEQNIALHVIVVGFHHKKGMVMEHAYPSFENNELPDKWKHLPSLCLPDGSHNHEADVVYFHLPHLTKDDQTVFGVSCYQQIDAQKVTKKTDDITRNSVQKSVCVLTTLPIYGYIQERLKVTTKLYFKEADFSDFSDLQGLFHDLNTTNWKDKLMHGVAASDAVRTFGRNILILFKLLLLERKVLFYHSPVEPLVKTITSLLMLLPATFPDGLCQSSATCNVFEAEELTENDIPVSEVSEEANEDKIEKDTDEFFDSCDVAQSSSSVPVETGIDVLGEVSDELSDMKSSNSSLTSVTSRGSIITPEFDSATRPTNFTSKFNSFKGKLSGAFNYWTVRDKNMDNKPSSTVTPNPSPSEPENYEQVSPCSEAALLPEEHLNEIEEEFIPFSKYADTYAQLDCSSCGLPLHIFTKGNVFFPYLSLQYLDVLNESSTRAFIVGASNTLFMHKKSLYDVLIEIDGGKIDVADPDLKRQLFLSTEDLRFSENILRQVETTTANRTGQLLNDQSDVFLDGVGWIGGEEWLRYQFKIYLLAMLRSSVENSKSSDMYNNYFIEAWKKTHNYETWVADYPYESLSSLPCGHPNAGNLSISDMRIKLSHTIQGFDRNRRINNTISSTGTAVVKTKEAVGGALSSAKGAISTFWNSFTSHDKLVEVAEIATENHSVDGKNEDQDEVMSDEQPVEDDNMDNEDKVEEGDSVKDIQSNQTDCEKT